jgi:PKD repeat protein
MKRLLLLFSMIALMFAAKAQTIVFFDDFESGADNWIVDGYWDISDEYAYGGTYSFTDSPYDPTYIAGEVQTATMAESVDLSGALDATVSFYALIDLEEGFDYLYLDVSDDGGGEWIELAEFNGEGMLDEWMYFEYSLGAVVGSDDVLLRFRFVPDFFVEYDGMYVDDFTITEFTTDASPPLILHTPLNLYEGTIGDNVLEATLLDASGIMETELWYSADGAAYSSVTGSLSAGDVYSYTVPALEPGIWVDYYMTATDASDDMNSAATDTFSYIAGNYIGYDNGVIDFVQNVGEESTSGYEFAAVRITLDSFTTVVSAVIQNYTDNTRPNDSIEIHIWADDAGLPGDDLITPFKVFPEATLEEPNKGTRIDLRPFADELEGLIGDIYVGYGSDSMAWLSQTTPGDAGRTFVFSFGSWIELTDDYHFRVVTGPYSGAPMADFDYDAASDPTIYFTDLSTNFPDSWEWVFGDGGTSTDQDPVHSYLTNGAFEVCLTASNALGSDTHCEEVTISSYEPPVADFSFDDSADPLISFTDLSTNSPDSWEWDFGDGGTSTAADPTHTYTTNGTFTVCLTAGNLAGSDEVCKDVTVDGNIVAPEADYAFSAVGLEVTFTDLSTNDPTFWGWTFGDGATSLDQNPVHAYTAAGTYEACMTAGNIAGTDEVCKQVMLGTSVEDLAAAGILIHPNPVADYLNVQYGWAENGTFRIYDLNGKLVAEGFLQSGSQSIDVGQLTSGVYRLVINNANRIASGSLVIER